MGNGALGGANGALIGANGAGAYGAGAYGLSGLWDGYFGGAGLTGYGLSNTNFTVNDLEEGKEYEFRVFAENEIGESEPLTTARPILAKNQYSVSLPPSQPD